MQAEQITIGRDPRANPELLNAIRSVWKVAKNHKDDEGNPAGMMLFACDLILAAIDHPGIQETVILEGDGSQGPKGLLTQ